ncbi:hypothetical protein Cch02nite_41030 [Catellatospora chokoriensis]|uniref:Uncharacterized protein n=2 Tax=Catellatospora chokoriensis TaxID=310353 RepID=A0A8J3JY76_9ACTN|nr:hypothetical protein Cch02nite_41030 [Catellatospora chokoriensis]
MLGKWRESRADARALRERKEQAWYEWHLRYEERLAKTAGLSTMTMVCHAHTLAFIERFCQSRKGWFPIEEQRKEQLDGDTVRVQLSGRQVGTMLFVFACDSGILYPDSPSMATTFDSDRVVLAELYKRLGAVVDEVTAESGAPLVLTMDDRPSTAIVMD